MAEGRLRAYSCELGVGINFAPGPCPVTGGPKEAGSLADTRLRTCTEHAHTAVVWDGTALRECPLCAAARKEVPPTREIHVVFDGPPETESGRFVEVETADGRGVAAGRWLHRPDGLWALVLETVSRDVAR
jgi:hypothetical protein